MKKRVRVAKLHSSYGDIPIMTDPRVPKDQILVVDATTKWTRYDTYEKELKMSRWIFLKSFFRGYVIIRWRVPSYRKDKRLKLTGRRLW